jgi:hypothetical protein
MNRRDAEQVAPERSAIEHRDDTPDRAARPRGKREPRDGRTERHQQEHLRRRVLPLIE